MNTVTGIPAAWMLSNSGTEETLTWFLSLVKSRNPTVRPNILMTDHDNAQINALRAVYTLATIFLCWWHVLHAWQQHFRIPNHRELWDLLKSWIRITNRSKSDEHWAKIQQIAPEPFVQYLQTYWMPDAVVRMWSAVYRVGRSIFEDCETNMLIEAWHHVLKGKFLRGKRNRQADHLIHCLLEEVVPYYRAKKRDEDHGFSGGDLEVTRRKEITARAHSFTEKDVTVCIQFLSLTYLILTCLVGCRR